MFRIHKWRLKSYTEVYRMRRNSLVEELWSVFWAELTVEIKEQGVGESIANELNGTKWRQKKIKAQIILHIQGINSEYTKYNYIFFYVSAEPLKMFSKECEKVF